MNELTIARGALRCAAAAAMALAGAAAAMAQTADIARNRAVERKTFSDAEIARGLFAVAFGAEFNVAGRVDRIRRFEDPIRIYIDNRATPDRTSQVAAVVEDIRSRVEHLDIAVTQKEDEANVVVTLTRDRELGPLIKHLYGIERARQIQRNLEPQCLSGFRKDADFRIQKSDVLIVADVGDYIFFDCIYEELLQALGPINDDENVPWTMFNDEVQMGFFGIYDQYLLNIIYHPRIHAGMTRDEVGALLPDIMPEVRSFVTRINPPAGRSVSGAVMSRGDVAKAVSEMAASKRERLDWRRSIVDLLKALNLDSSLAARRMLARELQYPGDIGNSARMNAWLHVQVMNKLTASGGQMPAGRWSGMPRRP